MNFFKEMWTCFCRAFQLFATFKGRASRREYWLFVLCDVIFVFMLLCLPLVYLLVSLLNVGQNIFNVFVGDFSMITSLEVFCMIWLIVGIIYTLITIIPHLSLSVRRLHDTNKSGKWLWFVYAPFFIRVFSMMVIVFLLAESGQENASSLLWHGIDGLAALVQLVAQIVFIVFFCLASDKGDNRFGKQPERIFFGAKHDC